jgi:hypothetical protein
VARTESTRARAAVAAANAPRPNPTSGHEAAQPEGHAEHHGEDADPGRDGQALPQHRAVDLAPAQRRRHGHEEQEGQADRDGHGVEERRAHIDLLLRHGLVEKRVQGAQQDDEGEADEEQVVEEEGTLAAQGGVDAARRAQAVAPPGDEPEADHDHQRRRTR